MAIFPVIDCDTVVQVADKFRILADKSYKTQDVTAWVKVEIEPFAGAGFVDVTGDLSKPKPERNWYLDYQYPTSGAKVVSVKITTNPGTVITTQTKTVTCVSSAEDNLFSTDDLLKEIQEDIYRLLPEGRSSFKYKHRAAQNFMLDWLWNNGYNKTLGNGVEPYVKADIVDKEFISDWATYVAIRMIYESNQSQGGDVFKQRAMDFMAKEERARDKVILKIDTDNSGTLGANEGAAIQSRRLVRV